MRCVVLTLVFALLLVLSVAVASPAAEGPRGNPDCLCGGPLNCHCPAPCPCRIASLAIVLPDGRAIVIARAHPARPWLDHPRVPRPLRPWLPQPAPPAPKRGR